MDGIVVAGAVIMVAAMRHARHDEPGILLLAPVDADDQRALQLARIAGWGLHPLESAALSRRTP